jgi:hypothetical protein
MRRAYVRQASGAKAERWRGDTMANPGDVARTVGAILRRVGVALSLGLVCCALAADGHAAEAAATQPDIRYVLDKGFPQSSPIGFADVSWPAFDAANRRLVLLQRSAEAVSFWTPKGNLVSSWRNADLGKPHSITLHSDASGTESVWITDMAPPNPAGPADGHCLKRFTPEGKLVDVIGVCGAHSQGRGLDPVQFDLVTDIAFDARGNLLVSDGDIGGLNNRVLQLDPAGKVLQVWSAPDDRPGAGPKEFNLPHALKVDGCERVWVADTLNHRIQVISTGGVFLGELRCFGDDGVYGIDLVPIGTALSRLFVTSSPTSHPTGGTVHVLDVPMSCSRPDIIGDCKAGARWRIKLPPAPETAMLHAISVDPNNQDVYLSELGGDLPPQRWVRVGGAE